MFQYIFCCLLLLLPFSLKAQSGWAKQKGELFAYTGVQFYQSDQFFTLSGKKLETNVFSQQMAFLYAEYGVLERFTTIVNFPVFVSNGYETTERIYGIGDLTVELKYQLLRKYINLAYSIAPQFPTAAPDNFARNLENPIDRINIPTGDGEFNVWNKLAISQSLPGSSLYGTLYGAYNVRTHYEEFTFNDQYQFGMELGYNFFKRIWLNAKVQTQNTVGDTDGLTDFVRGDGSEYTAFSVGITYEVIKHWNLTFNYFTYTDWIVSRKNIYSPDVFTVGIFYQNLFKQKE